MGLFQQFPFTNLHELNLDWLIKAIKDLGEHAVLSVNGETGEVVLYKSENIVFPEVTADTWRMVRVADGHTAGIMFQNGLLYVMYDNAAERVYTVDHPPVYPVTSVNGQTGAVETYKTAYNRLAAVSEQNTNFYRTIDKDGTPADVGVQVDKNKIERMNGVNRYKVYDEGNTPNIVTSVNGESGPVVIAIPFADVETDNVMFQDAAAGHSWSLGRETLDGVASIQLETSASSADVYIRFFTEDDPPVSYVRKLLTLDDIPSASGVVSLNGMTGVVTLYGDTMPIESGSLVTVKQAIDNVNSAVTANVNALAPAIDPDTMQCAVTIPKGDFCQINGVFYLNISGAALPANTTISMASLQAVSSLGVLNEELEHPAMRDVIITRTSAASHIFTVPDNSCNLFVFEGNGGSRMYSALVYRAAGNVTLDEITKGSGISDVTTSGNTFTITPASANTCIVRVFNIAGDVIY